MIKKILMSTLLCWPLAAQGPVLPLSLKQAVDLALTPQGSTRVQFAQELIQQAEARRKQALGALLPNVEGFMSAQDQTRNLAALGLRLSSPIPGFSLPNFVGPFSYYDARATATQSVFDFSAIRRYQAARSGIEVARAEDESTRNQVSDQVARAYLATLRAQVVAETAAANVELADRLRRLAASQKEAGTGTGIEITRAQVQLANERQRQLVAENELDRARLQLMRAMGLDLQTKVQLTDTLKHAPVEVTDPQKALEVALAKRADLKSQRKREDNARLSYSAVKSERLPSVSAFGDYGNIGTSLTENRPTRTIGVTMRVPIFDGGRRDARRAESASLLRQEGIRSNDLRQQLELEVRLALDSLRSAEQQVKTAEEGQQLAENELAQAERRYKAGVGTSVEVTDAQTRMARARENSITALFSHNLARIDLNSATGTIQSLVNNF